MTYDINLVAITLPLRGATNPSGVCYEVSNEVDIMINFVGILAVGNLEVNIDAPRRDSKRDAGLPDGIFLNPKIPIWVNLGGP
jgi:hypothetical protein